MYEKECQKLLKEDLVLPAYDYVLKCSHAFNMLDARGQLESHSVRVTLEGLEILPVVVRKTMSNCARHCTGRS